MMGEPYRRNCVNAPCERSFYDRSDDFEAPPFRPCPLARTQQESLAIQEKPYTAGEGVPTPNPPSAPRTARAMPARAEHIAEGRKEGEGATIPFASGTAINLISGANGSRSTVGLIGFGSGVSFAAPVDPINISTLCSDAVNVAFSMPAGGTLTAMSAYFSLTIPGLVGVDSVITAQLYISPFPNDSFMPVTTAKVRLGTVRGGAPAGETLHGRVDGLAIPLAPETRLLMVFSSVTPQGVSSAVAGFMSAGVRIS